MCCAVYRMVLAHWHIDTLANYSKQADKKRNYIKFKQLLNVCVY